jgi:hypothetical protein
MFIEALEDRQMFSVAINTNTAPTQSVGAVNSVNVSSTTRQTFSDTLSTRSVATADDSKSSQISSTSFADKFRYAMGSILSGASTL